MKGCSVLLACLVASHFAAAQPSSRCKLLALHVDVAAK